MKPGTGLPPGYNVISLSADGTINNVSRRQIVPAATPPAQATPRPTVPQRETSRKLVGSADSATKRVPHSLGSVLVMCTGHPRGCGLWVPGSYGALVAAPYGTLAEALNRDDFGVTV